MHTQYLTTGEFAQLCGVKKATLFHYDAIGLLCPELVAENGYRFYSRQQVQIFDLIDSLRSIGTPLSEIRSYMENRNPQLLVALLEEKQRQLEETQRQLRQLQRLLRNTLRETRLGTTVTCGEVHLEEMGSDYLIATSLVPQSEDDKLFLQTVTAHIRYCTDHKFSHHFPLGELLSGPAFAQGSFHPAFLCSRVDHRVRSSRLVVRPAGTCAVLYYRGGYDTLEQGYRQLHRWIAEYGFTVTGDVLEEDLLYYLSQPGTDDYVMKISAPVAPKKA